MITPNFRAGKEMDRSHTELDEFRYQHRGYAKYADIVRLFGWQAWTGYYHKRNVDWNDVTWSSRASWLDGLDGVDRRTFEFSIQANCDLTALIHFWGIHPVDVTALSAKMAANDLTACKEVLCLLKRYRTLIPKDNAEFNTFFEKIHPGRPIVSATTRATAVDGTTSGGTLTGQPRARRPSLSSIPSSTPIFLAMAMSFALTRSPPPLTWRGLANIRGFPRGHLRPLGATLGERRRQRRHSLWL